MGSILSGCQGKPELEIIERDCPSCGNLIEIMSTDTDARCEKCGFTIYNDSLSCVQWCDKARECFGDEAYEQLMAVAAKQKERAAQK